MNPNSPALLDADVVSVARLTTSDGDVLVVKFVSRDHEYGYSYEGIFRLALHLGSQDVRGRLDSKDEVSGALTEIQFRVRGQFRDRRFSTFAGEWYETSVEGRADYYVTIRDLPRRHA